MTKLPLQPCAHEPELKTLLTRGQWPSAAPAELRTHVAACRSCSNLALLTTTFQASRAQATAQVQLPPPGLIWWRAQLHRRNQALERINRPIAGALLLALASISITLVILALFIRHDLGEWFNTLSSPGASHRASLFSPSHLHASATEWLTLTSNPTYLLPAIALILLAGGVTLYLANERS